MVKFFFLYPPHGLIILRLFFITSAAIINPIFFQNSTKKIPNAHRSAAPHIMNTVKSP